MHFTKLIWYHLLVSFISYLFFFFASMPITLTSYNFLELFLFLIDVLKWEMFHVRMYDQLCFNYVCFHMVWLILGYLNFSSTRFIIKVVIRGSVIQPEQNFLSETMLVVKFVAGSKERVTYLHCPVEINLYGMPHLSI